MTQRALDVVDAAVASHAIPGAVAIILGETRLEGAFGAVDPGSAAAMTLDTVFWLASMTKPLTTLAAMRLVDRGLLSLDEPVARLLPQLAQPLVLEGFSGGGVPALRPAHEPVTLRRLLSHTSGYAYARWDADLLRAITALGIAPMVRDWESLARMPLVFEPGAGWTYGIGVDVAGKLIEAAAGATLDAVIEAEVTGPLGMVDTRFVLTDAQRSRATPIHVRDGGRWVPSGGVGGRRMPFLGGGGGLYGTARDYARLLQELLQGAPNLLPAGLWAELTRNQIGSLNVTVLHTTDLGQSLDLDLAAGQVAKWGLGFMLNPGRLPARRGGGSLFWCGLANTYFWVDPGAQVAGLLMMNLLPFGHPAAFGLFEAFEAAVYA